MAFSIRASVKKVEGERGICFDYEGPGDEAGNVEEKAGGAQVGREAEEGVAEAVEEGTSTGSCVEEEDCVGV